MVCHRLDGLDSDYVRIDPSCLLAEDLYSIDPLDASFSQGKLFASFRNGFDAEPVAGNVFNSIYWRRPLRVGDRIKMAYPSVEEISPAETFHAFRLAVDSLPDSYFPLGHPAAMERASNKLLQLRLANEMGFRVPETLVGNDPQVIGGFLERHSHLVVKPIHINSFYEGDKGLEMSQALWCRGIDPKKMATRLHQGRRAQLMLQQQVLKKEDWRITVLPNTSVCCKIDTSGLTTAEPDWRKAHKKYQHSLFDPSPEFERLLREYLQALGLKAGYFDFAVDESGEPYFLEVNTNAEWLWIEELTGYPISEEVAKCLDGREQ